MMLYERPVQSTVVTLTKEAVSPPGLSTATTSKSSKSSSFQSSRSYGSDRESVLTDVSHFEDIGLEDDAPRKERGHHQPQRDPSPYASSYASELRANTKALAPKGQQQQQQPQQPIRSLSKSRTLQVTQREIITPKTTSMRRRPSSPNRAVPGSLHPDPHVRSTSTNGLQSGSVHDKLSLQINNNNGRVIPNSRPAVLSFNRRNRTPSPNTQHRPSLSINPVDPAMARRLPKRSSWQGNSSNRERKTEAELDKECDEDEGDDIPEGLVLDNVPLSPRPASERTKSLPPSKASSPERKPIKETKVRSVGNGTPASGAAHGSIKELRSPSAHGKRFPRPPGSDDTVSPLKSRAHSWNAHLAELNSEVKELTEKLEEHAEELELKSTQRSSTGSLPRTAARRTSSSDAKPKHKSALAELPPLRRSNIMIDPLPISKEKEAVLSRTRPSWLPPKDPAEERRHLREYQKMMAASQEAERRREQKKRAASANKDTAADSLMQIWERDVVPRWGEAVRERRTRELWWVRGVAPRCRGAVWARAIGNDLGLSEGSFQAALGRATAAEAREKAGHGSAEDHRCVSWMHAIRRDAEEHTWRDLRIFQAGGPLHESLLAVLSAYTMYRRDIGYVSGCNTIAALLLLNTPSPAAAFIALANLLNRALPLSFYSDDAGAKSSAYNLMLQTLAAKSPKLHDHLVALPQHDADAYLGDIYTSLFTNHLSLDEASRLWDVYVFEGDAVMVRAGVAVLLEHEMALLGTKSVDEVRGVIRAKKQRLVGKPGDEERWISLVREAGKA